MQTLQLRRSLKPQTAQAVTEKATVIKATEEKSVSSLAETVPNRGTVHEVVVDVRGVSRGQKWPRDTLTGYEPNKELNLVNTKELDFAATSDVYWQHTLDDDASLNDPNVDDNQIAKYFAVVIDSTGKFVEMRSSNDQFSCDTRKLKSVQSQFLVVSQTEMIC